MLRRMHTLPQYRPLAQIDRLHLTCTGTPDGESLTLDEIDALDLVPVLRRSDVPLQSLDPRLAGIAATSPLHRFLAAHFYVDPLGVVTVGRHPEEIPGLVAAPRTALLVCLLGTRRYSAAAWSALRVLLRGRPAVEHYRAQPGVVPDHLPLSGDPGFDVAAWVAADFQPLPGHLL